jgi:hypothetical protein
MVKLLMIMQHITLCIPCIAFMLLSFSSIFAIDHAEQGHEEPPKPGQVESADID